jgi:hypothetical protein
MTILFLPFNVEVAGTVTDIDVTINGWLCRQKVLPSITAASASGITAIHDNTGSDALAEMCAEY